MQRDKQREFKEDKGQEDVLSPDEEATDDEIGEGLKTLPVETGAVLTTLGPLKESKMSLYSQSSARSRQSSQEPEEFKDPVPSER